MIYNTIDELHHKVWEKVYEVYDIFKNFFGEEFTDLQDIPCPEFSIPSGIASGDLSSTDISNEQIENIRYIHRERYPSIIVYWPKVTITNENDKSIEIQKLFAKITINIEGKIPYEHYGFTLNRSFYPMIQFMSGYNHRGYMHSHINGIPKHNLSEFQQPCLGTGPIRGTIATLKTEYDEVTWILFCQELSMYVTVESLKGVPYNKLEEVGNLRCLHGFNNFSKVSRCDHEGDMEKLINIISKDKYKDFIEYYLKRGNINLSYSYGVYTLGMPFYDFIIDISNAFIDFFNIYLKDICDARELFTNGILYKVIISDGKFFTNGAIYSVDDVRDYIGKHVLFFKGEDIRLEIDDSSETNPIISNILDKNIAQHIIQNILTVINYRYKNGHNNQERRNQTFTPTYQNVRYL